MKLTAEWKYSSEYGDRDEGTDVFDVASIQDGLIFTRESDSEARKYQTLGEFIENEFPEDDAFAGGFDFVEIKDEEGKVLFSRGDRQSSL